jgi:hypothetical protein
MPDYRDLSQAHRAIADGLRFYDSISLINYDNDIIRKGIMVYGSMIVYLSLIMIMTLYGRVLYLRLWRQ